MRITRTSRYRWLPVRIDDFEKWQSCLLEESARRLSALLDPGGRIHRWGFVGSPVMFRGQRAWLRVSPFLEHEMSGKAWRGTAEAAAIPGVSKPALLHRVEWHTDGPSPVPVSAEVLTLVTDPPASRERFLRTAPDLPADWFSDLRTSLTALHAYPTDRQFPVHDAEEYGYLLGATYRRPVPAECVPAFGTEHIDLNWQNITAPRFCILDMEHWCSAVRAGWGTDLADRPIGETILIRPETVYRYARASYEVNLGCNYDCEHCYLGEKMFAGMDWPGRERLLQVMAEAGVLWLQLTGGEPLIDPLFAETHARAWDMGMMIQISSNGSRLDRPKTLDLLTARRPYRLTLSLYGATEESYDGMTRRRGSFRRFMRGLAAAHEAGLAMRINIVVSNRNAHEVPAMRAIADRFGIKAFEYTNISPTIHGGGEVLPSQSREMLRKRKPYTGCNAGITHFHTDPHGKASICKVGRDPQVDLIAEGADGLRRLAAAADALLTRHGGCTGCTLQKTCGTCMPLASLYRQAKAPLEVFCQHGGR